MKRSTKHAYRCPTCGQRVGLTLTPEDVRAIRVLLKSGAKQCTVAKAFGVTESAIYRIKSGKIWSHL